MASSFSFLHLRQIRCLYIRPVIQSQRKDQTNCLTLCLIYCSLGSHQALRSSRGGSRELHLLQVKSLIQNTITTKSKVSSPGHSHPTLSTAEIWSNEQPQQGEDFLQAKLVCVLKLSDLSACWCPCVCVSF